jgi:hypothetical protein
MIKFTISANMIPESLINIITAEASEMLIILKIDKVSFEKYEKASKRK